MQIRIIANLQTTHKCLQRWASNIDHRKAFECSYTLVSLKNFRMISLKFSSSTISHVSAHLAGSSFVRRSQKNSQKKDFRREKNTKFLKSETLEKHWQTSAGFIYKTKLSRKEQGPLYNSRPPVSYPGITRSHRSPWIGPLRTLLARRMHNAAKQSQFVKVIDINAKMQQNVFSLPSK